MSDLGGGVGWTHLCSGQFCGADTGVVAAMLGVNRGSLSEIRNTEYEGRKLSRSPPFSRRPNPLEKIQRYQRAAKKAVNIVVASQGKHMFRGIYVLKFQYSRHAFLLKSFFLFTSPVPQICSNATKYDHKEQSLLQQREAFLSNDIANRPPDRRDLRGRARVSDRDLSRVALTRSILRRAV